MREALCAKRYARSAMREALCAKRYALARFKLLEFSLKRYAQR
jgi:hypothetical protein